VRNKQGISISIAAVGQMDAEGNKNYAGAAMMLRYSTQSQPVFLKT